MTTKYQIWRPRGEQIHINTEDRSDSDLPPFAIIDTTQMGDDDAFDAFGEMERLVHVANLYADIELHIIALTTALRDIEKMGREGFSENFTAAYNMTMIAKNALETLQSTPGRVNPLLGLLKKRSA